MSSITRTGVGIFDFDLIELIVAALRSVLDAVVEVGSVPFIAGHRRPVDSDVFRRLALGENVHRVRVGSRRRDDAQTVAGLRRRHADVVARENTELVCSPRGQSNAALRSLHITVDQSELTCVLMER